MTTYQQYEQQFVADLVGAPAQRAPAAHGVGTEIMPSLKTLLDAMPFYGATPWDAAHRGALVNLLQSNLPNSVVAPQPSNSDYSYRYTGPYSGYRDAFYTGIAQTPAAAAVVAQLPSALGPGWWGNYGVAVLTDAVRRMVALSLDTGKLASALSSYNTQLLPVLSATCLSVYKTGYAPTANAYRAIGQPAQALAELNSAILRGQFTANINLSIAMGGPSTIAATWFLFNLWITLKALGAVDVDAAIRSYRDAGLTVPPQVGPGSWWNGGYTTWYLPLSGSDISSPTITASMPETRTAWTSQGLPVARTTSLANGYAQSLCYWGNLNWYPPLSDSCFGAGTGVWMADGSTKPIDQVKAGDDIRTTVGPRPVLLVEAPLRAGRTLYRLGDMKVSVTASHPFRAASSSGMRRLAIDAWGLADAVPTMLPEGIGRLVEGTSLHGAAADRARDIPVAAIHPLPGPGEAHESVYDLIVGESGSPAYYVGGPEVFVEVDAETADPSFHLPATAAISAMMRSLLPVVRRHPPENATHLLRAAIGSIAARDVVAGSGSGTARMPLSGVPGPGFFKLPDGSWDARASAMEAQLVRRFGRVLRREAASGWRRHGAARGDCGAVTFVVHDFELIDAVVPAGVGAAVRVELRTAGVVQTLPVARSDGARGLVTVDAALDFGNVADDAAFVATAMAGDQVVGHARVPVGAEGVEHLLFAPDGRVNGRIAVEQLRAAPDAAAWSMSAAMVATMELGQRIAERIAASIPAPETK
ncbi:MAG TPA: hypothetical protein VEO54_22620 [Thermoanaerobaculia bacterium]|nr:hypothetical protein [Thermoanaerobaculia bacterium]